eukprot:COSAG01_NODE_3_length_63519_cov_1591.007663_11_plen_239_part_00
MLEAKNLKKTFQKNLIVNELSIQAKQGEITGLLGPNGAGKTTSFYLIAGLIQADQGSISINNKDISSLPMYKRAKVGLGYLPQESSIFKKLTVEENLYIVWEYNKEIKKSDYNRKATELLEEMKLTKLRHRPCMQLSGGEKRRVEIMRVLSLNPKFILLDEPFAGIDPLAIEDIQQIIKNLKKKGLGVIITDHNVRETLAITDKAYIMHEGKILLSGTTQEIIKNKTAKQYYLGETFK